MLDPAVRALILEEQRRQLARFIEGVDLEAYLEKLGEHAEFVTDEIDGRCRGVVAFYCNDLASRRAFITLVLVDPRDRGAGLGRALVARTLAACRERGFAACRLEVRKDNAVALEMYRSMGFIVVEDRPGRSLLEAAL